MNLEVTFKGPFVFRFRMEAKRRRVSIYAPRRADHYAHAITDRELRMIAGCHEPAATVAAANYELSVGYESGGGRPAVCYRSSELLNVKAGDVADPDGPPEGSYLMKIEAPQPDGMLGLQADPTTFEGLVHRPALPKPGRYARGLRFYYENFDLKAGFQLTGAAGGVVIDTRQYPAPPAPQNHVPVLIRYADRSPQVGGGDENAAACFLEMGKLFPPLERWRMRDGAAGSGAAMPFDFVSDCGAPVLVIADPGAVGWSGLGDGAAAG
jgi:hypothetical protein